MDAAGAPGWRRWTRPLLLAGVLVLAVVVTDVVVLGRPWASGKPHSSACPRFGAGLFTGQTYSFTRVRDAAALSASVVRTVPAGCTVPFSGYCLGDVVIDDTSKTPDIRWFIVSGGGLMASGVVHGNPPPTLGPSSCPGDIAPPASIHLAVHRIGAQLQLQATGKGVEIVGFTSLDPGEAGDQRWHQIGDLIPSPTSQAETRWQPGLGPADKSVTVAAVACLGGDGPTTVIDAEKVQRSGPPHFTSTLLSGAALDAATRSACQY